MVYLQILCNLLLIFAVFEPSKKLCKRFIRSSAKIKNLPLDDEIVERKR